MTDQLPAAAAAVDRAADVVAIATDHLARAANVDGRISVAKLDEHQVLGYDLAHAASAVEGAKVMLDYAEHGEVESLLARAFIADAVADLGAKVLGREAVWGVDAGLLADALPFVEAHRSPDVPRVRSPRPSSSRVPARATCPTTSSSRRRRSAASPRTRSAPSPSTCTAPTPTSPRTSSAAWPRSAASGSRCPRSTAGSRAAAKPTTSAWSSPPRSSPGARSGWADR